MSAAAILQVAAALASAGLSLQTFRQIDGLRLYDSIACWQITILTMHCSGAVGLRLLAAAALSLAGAAPRLTAGASVAAVVWVLSTIYAAR